MHTRTNKLVLLTMLLSLSAVSDFAVGATNAFCQEEGSQPKQDQEEPITVGPAARGAASFKEIEIAETKLKESRNQYSKIRELAKRGSISKSRFQRSKYAMQVAELELNALKNPKNASQFRLEIAKLQLKNTEQRFETSKQMYARGSVSKLQHRRTSYQVKYARIALKVATGEYSAQSGKLLLAKERLKLARIELKLGKKLLQQRSISQTGYQQLVDRVREAEQAKDEIEKQLKQNQKAIKNRFGT